MAYDSGISQHKNMAMGCDIPGEAADFGVQKMASMSKGGAVSDNGKRLSDAQRSAPVNHTPGRPASQGNPDHGEF